MRSPPKGADGQKGYGHNWVVMTLVVRQQPRS